ncbi:MAG: hypothetical protein AB8B93_19295 [Pseudomonadales bacterium]
MKSKFDGQDSARALGWILLSSLAVMSLTAGFAMAEEAALTDPTRPNWYGLQAAVKHDPKRPVLNSIISSDDRRLAVINGALMREGERKRGLLLQEVLPDRVLVVTADNELQALRLAAPKIRKSQ